jgi:hypothetical protein
MRTLVFEDWLFQMPPMTRGFFPRKMWCIIIINFKKYLIWEAQQAEHVVCMAEIRNVSGIFVWRPLVEFRCRCKDRKYILKPGRKKLIWQYYLRRLWAFGVCKSHRISWIAKQTLSSQEGCCCVELSVFFFKCSPGLFLTLLTLDVTLIQSWQTSINVWNGQRFS